MIVMITLDTNYQKIWEKSGIATFDSYYEGVQTIKKLQESLHEKLYAIGLYRSHKTSPQPFPPSLLQITGATLMTNCRSHDIKIYFRFLQKLPIEFNTCLHQLLPDSRPLFHYIDDDCFAKLQNTFNVFSIIKQNRCENFAIGDSAVQEFGERRSSSVGRNNR